LFFLKKNPHASLSILLKPQNDRDEVAGKFLASTVDT